MPHQLSLRLDVRFNERQQLVYDELCRAAKHGEPCPTNTAIGQRLEISEGVVANIISEIDQLGMITRRSLGVGRREVVICATGDKTVTENSQQDPMSEPVVQDANARFAALMGGKRFEDHPKAKTGKCYPKFYPARHQAYGHEAMC